MHRKNIIDGSYKINYTNTFKTHMNHSINSYTFLSKSKGITTSIESKFNFTGIIKKNVVLLEKHGDFYNKINNVTTIKSRI